MTRGRFFIVVKDENDKLMMYVSPEFNGDMYIEEGSCGEDAAKTFTKTNVIDVEDFKTYVEEFNKRNFQYDDIIACWKADSAEDEFSFSGVTDIFDVTSYSYHSDYMFVRNLTDDVVEMKADNGIVQIQPFGGAVFNFDEFYDLNGTEFEDNFGAELVYDSTNAIKYVDEVRAMELVENHGLTEEESQELIDNHMDHFHDIICIYEDVEDVAEAYIDSQDVDEYIRDFIDRQRLGNELIANDECYYKFDCTERVLYYTP